MNIEGCNCIPEPESLPIAEIDSCTIPPFRSSVNVVEMGASLWDETCS